MRIAAIISLIVVMFSAGCASVYKTIQHNDKVQTARKMIEIKPEQGWDGSWQVKAGIDLTALAKSDTGYFAAWKDDPAGMTFATVLDASVVAGAAYLLKETQDTEKEIVQSPPTYEIHADNVIIGNNNQQTFGGE